MLDEETIPDRGISPRYRYPARKVCAMVEVGDVSHPCGDEIQLYAEIDTDIIIDMGFDSRACCMTTALMDILCERLIGRTVEALMLISPDDVVRVPVLTNRQGCIRLPFELLKALYGKAKAVRPEGTGSEDSGCSHRDAGTP